MVVGLIPATHGRVFLDGQNITGAPMWRRARAGVGYLPQEASVFRKLTVWENVMAVVETLGLNERERKERTAEQLAELGLEKLARQPAFTLSGGERRRLEIARALATGPASCSWTSRSAASTPSPSPKSSRSSASSRSAASAS
jgi:lipopolysaccharide export system ATP-binding protein